VPGRRPPEALIFDCFGVLVAFDESILLDRLAPHCAAISSSFDIHSLVAGEELITGRLALPALHASLIETVGLSLDFRDFEALWSEPYSWAMDGMAELVRELAAAYPLVLLSNIDADYWRAIRPLHPELDYFKKLLLSWEIGVAKPARLAFELACEAADAPAEHCLFIDDTSRNVDAALGAGLQALRFTGASQLTQDLRNAGVRGI
jgi:FMN phosphatase YigB (HAD superfamily)